MHVAIFCYSRKPCLVLVVSKYKLHVYAVSLGKFYFNFRGIDVDFRIIESTSSWFELEPP